MSDIPGKFFNYETGAPFSECLICGRDLHSPPVRYMIEKCIRRYPDMDHEDIIYEYAMCLDCAGEQQKFISSESLQNISAYFSKHLSVDMKNESVEVPGTCSLHQTPIEQMQEYILQGGFQGLERDRTIPMMLIGQRAMEEIQELLSDSTRDGMDDFMDTHFSGPPEFRELLRERKTVII